MSKGLLMLSAIITPFYQQYCKSLVKKYQTYYAHVVRQVLNEKELQMLDSHIDGYACNSKPFQLVPGIVFLTVKKLKPA